MSKLVFLNGLYTPKTLISGGALAGDVAFTRASSAGVWINGVYTTKSTNVPRFGNYEMGDSTSYTGLVSEAARTNSIKNSSMTGASVPSTFPTNWVVADVATGLSADVAAVGTIGDLPYIDIRFHGTASGSGVYIIKFTQDDEIVASNGQTWTSSVYMGLVGGTKTNVTAFYYSIVTRGAGGTYLSESAIDILSTFNSTFTRQILTRTLNNALTGGTDSYFYFTASAGAIDMTVRFAGPQMELGAFPSTYIPTVNAAVTRAADICNVTSLSTKPWWNAAQGTILADFQRTSLANAYGTPVSCNNNSSTERIDIKQDGTANFAVYGVDVSSSTAYTTFSVTPGSAVRCKAAFAFKVNDFALCVNASTVQTDNAGVVATPTQIQIGNNSWDSNGFYGIINNVTTYITRKSNSDLQTITT